MTGKREHTLVITGDAGIKSAAEVATGLKDALASHNKVCVDTRTLTAADISTVQSLLAARSSAAAQGKSLLMAVPLGAPLSAVLQAAGFLAASQVHRDFWIPSSDQP